MVVIAAVQQGLVRPGDVREALARRGACRHRAVIVESVLDAIGGIQSLPERDHELLRIRAGLPRPSRQSVRKRADGRCYLDVEWTEYDAACEIHGIPTSTSKGTRGPADRAAPAPRWVGREMRHTVTTSDTNASSPVLRRA